MALAVIAQCPSCRALVSVASVVVDGSRLGDGTPRAGLPCPSCGAIAWLALSTTITQTRAPSGAPALPAAAPDALPAPTPQVVLPTEPVHEAAAPVPPAVPVAPAAAPEPAAAAPLSKGLAPEARAAVLAKLAPPTESQTTLAERFDVLLREKWHSESDHKALLKAASAADQLAFVGARYRAVLDVVRDEPRAKAAQSDLLTLAMAAMKPTAASTEEGSRTKLYVAAVFAVVIAGGVFVVARMALQTFAKLGAIE